MPPVAPNAGRSKMEANVRRAGLRRRLGRDLTTNHRWHWTSRWPMTSTQATASKLARID